jgi:hypothetical protein
MPRRSTTVEVLRARASLLHRQIIEANAKEKARKASEDQRRSMLVGQAALARMTAEPQGAFAATLLGLINENARSVADRALFNLPPLPKEPESAPAKLVYGTRAGGNTNA